MEELGIGMIESESDKEGGDNSPIISMNPTFSPVITN